jgi:hypothetical protein
MISKRAHERSAAGRGSRAGTLPDAGVLPDRTP